ncbi:MAG: nitroreductase family protein [Mediterranea sp.]|jgi:predicted oxidoreductase (fatty acid repression mutant protein)|nr:nitroreductase family protein [Mediterranea sp.]
METKFCSVLKNRRTYYAISGESPISDQAIEDIIRSAVKYVPSAFNSQSTRVVLLLGNSHRQLWDIVKKTLRKRVASDEAFARTEAKIDGSFASGYGTVLYFEDQTVVEGLQKSFPSYKDNFPGWSQQASAMHQLAIWTMLEEEGFGASLQHYNPLIDDEVRATWKLPETWKLIAQMPFGKPAQQPAEKEYSSVDDRIRVFK